MPDDALSQLGVARELDPLSLPITALRGSILAELGQLEEGMRSLHAALDLDSAFPLAHALLGHIHLGEGRTDEAITHYEQALASVPSSYYAGFLGHAYARDGRTADARRILATLEAREESGDYVSQGAIGRILLGLGERDPAFRYLGASARHGDVFQTIYGVLSNRHLSGAFREDPDFRRLRGQVGLAP